MTMPHEVPVPEPAPPYTDVPPPQPGHPPPPHAPPVLPPGEDDDDDSLPPPVRLPGRPGLPERVGAAT